MALIKSGRISDRAPAAPNLSGDQWGFYLFAFNLTRAPGALICSPEALNR